MDIVHFTGMEVLTMALRIEENGFEYYTGAGRAAKSRALKTLFKTLAEQEKEHIKVFDRLKVHMPEAPVAGDPYADEADMYLNAIADTKVFTSPGEGKKLASRIKSERQALSCAMGMEKDSILFYYEILKMIRDKDRVFVERLIEQEKEHLRKLKEAYVNLQARQ